MTQQDDRSKLIEAARRRIAAGDSKFSIAGLCAQAGVEREAFRAHFSGKSELLAAAAQAPQEPSPSTAARPAVTQPAAEPVAPTGSDAWLERRLRVFERALTALEARADANAREFSQALARLEEKLEAATGREGARPASATGVKTPVMAEPAKPVETVESAPVETAAAIPAQTPAEAETATGKDQEEAHTRQDALVLPLETPQETAVSKAEMAELLEGARRAARAAEAETLQQQDRKPRGRRLHWFALGGLSLVAMFVCAGVTLSMAARATHDPMDGNGVAHRQVAGDGFSRAVARADFGDPDAQAQLALAYLRGDHVSPDAQAAAHWAGQAALRGQAVAQYVMGALYHGGDGVPADQARAFSFFTEAAAAGNVKAMHNLAIAYAEGLGTARDAGKAAAWFAKAAARGYVDSAFDLAVLHERGEGVAQDLGAALKWYKVAALEGDGASQARIEVLSQQLSARDVQAAIHAAQSFAPIRVEVAANTLPKF